MHDSSTPAPRQLAARSAVAVWLLGAALLTSQIAGASTTGPAATRASVAMPAPVTTRADGGRYGEVHLIVPHHAIRAYVVLFSDRGGWRPADQAALQAIADTGALAVGVDTDTYLKNIAPGHDVCDQLVGDAEGLSWQLQRQYGNGNYRFPILAGIGAGGTLAWVTLSKAPGHTLSGAMSVNPSVALPGRRPMCPGAPVSARIHHEYVYGPIKKLYGFWTVAFEDAAPKSSRRHIEKLQRMGTPVAIAAEHGTPADLFAHMLAPHLAEIDTPPPGRITVSVDTLPLIELPAASPSPLLAVVFSGDGGWRDIDKSIAEALQRDGINVVGWDSVRYFWRRKTPKRAAADLTNVLEHYLARWHTRQIALVGYSFGADVLPFLYNDLPPALRSRVVLVSLLASSPRADWEIRVTGWLGAAAGGDDTTPLTPALATMPRGLIQCFYGREETDSTCPGMTPLGAEVIQTAGGHHFGGGYLSIEKQILTQFRQRAFRSGSVVAD